MRYTTAHGLKYALDERSYVHNFRVPLAVVVQERLVRRAFRCVRCSQHVVRSVGCRVTRTPSSSPPGAPGGPGVVCTNPGTSRTTHIFTKKKTAGGRSTDLLPSALRRWKCSLQFSQYGTSGEGVATVQPGLLPSSRVPWHCATKRSVAPKRWTAQWYGCPANTPTPLIRALLQDPDGNAIIRNESESWIMWMAWQQ